MAQLSIPEYHYTGPVHHYVSIAEGTPWYLGTAEMTPRVEIRPNYKDVMNDIAGRSLPGQRSWDGESAVTGTVLTRWSKPAYNAIELATGRRIAAGHESRWARGSPVFGEQTFQLWLVFEFYWNINYRVAGLEPGIYFPQVMLGAHTRDTLGTEAEKLLLAFDCQPWWQPQASYSSVSGTERSWLLYSKDVNYFPATVQVPQ